MNKIKEFISKNKELVIGVICILTTGAIGYQLTKIKPEVEDDVTVIDLRSSAHVPTIDTLDEAIDQFKQYQETNRSVAMFWENDEYAVLELDK